MKKWLRWIHRWLGLTLGVVLVVVSVSGSLLLFQPQFFRWAHGEMIPEQLSPQIGSVDRWLANAQAVAPPGGELLAIWPPRYSHNVSDAGMIVFAGLKPGGFGQTGFASVLIAPESGEVLGVVESDRSLAYAPLFLHGSLWSGAIGTSIVGFIAVGTCVMLLIGLYLWWPRLKQLAAKLSWLPLRNAKYAGRLHDLSGSWFMVLLLPLAFTGVYMAKPSWLEPALQTLPGDTPMAPVRAPDEDCAQVTLDQAIARAGMLVPGARWVQIEPVAGATGQWEVAFRGAGAHGAHSEIHVVADLQCGHVFLESTPATRSTRESVELWLMDLHDGSALGSVGEWLVTLSGLVPLILCWSGIRMWLRRRRASTRLGA